MLFASIDPRFLWFPETLFIVCVHIMMGDAPSDRSFLTFLHTLIFFAYFCKKNSHDRLATSRSTFAATFPTGCDCPVQQYCTMFKILTSPENIHEMILAEFDQNQDPNPVQQTYQALLSEANQAGSFQNMALALEKTGDYFCESTNGVLSAVRMYQFAITCLTQAPGQKVLTNVMKNAYRAEEEFYSKTVGIPADIFRPDQLPPGLAHSTAAFDIRLVFKAGTALLLQDQLEQAQDFFEKALTLYRLGLKRKTLDRADLDVYKACALTNRAEVWHRMKSLQNAKKDLKNALLLMEKNGATAEKRKVLSVLAGIERDQKHWARATALFKEVLELYQNNPPDLRGKAISTTGIGLLYVQRKQYKTALGVLSALKQYEGIVPDADLWWAVYWGLGCCCLAQNNDQQAYEYLLKSIDKIEAHQDNLCSDEDKASFVDSVQFVYDKTFEALLGMYAKGKPDFPAMLHLMERARAQSMRDLFGMGIQRPDWSDVQDYDDAQTLA